MKNAFVFRLSSFVFRLSSFRFLLSILIFLFMTDLCVGQIRLPCCDNGMIPQGGECSDMMHVKDYPNNCDLEVNITFKQCIIRHRDTSRFCFPVTTSPDRCQESDGSYFYRIDPAISCNPSSLTFSTFGQDSKESTLINNVYNWDSSLSWTSSSTKSWLSVSPSSGTLNSSTDLTVTVNPTNLGAGEYEGRLYFTSDDISPDNRQGNIRVELTVRGVKISGPTLRTSGQSGTWTAEITEMTSPYSYTWWKMYPCYQPLSGEQTRSAPCNTWIQLGSTGSSVTLSETESFKLKVKVVDNDNNIVYDEHSITVEPARKLNKSLAETDATGGFSVRNFTNPFNPSTVIEFRLPEADFVHVDIYNMHGQLVKNMVAAQYNKGVHRVVWDATDNRGNRVPAGTYFCLLTANQGIKTLKMTLLK
ncbi:T9SS type A sorting domain-containing protein [candidate division KSB1 bacterium]|nr:T9SS type A sorting domain-containing protein [candidate division KSB1 bacterium]